MSEKCKKLITNQGEMWRNVEKRMKIDLGQEKSLEIIENEIKMGKKIEN